jgi:hypothetical protein
MRSFKPSIRFPIGSYASSCVTESTRTPAQHLLRDACVRGVAREARGVVHDDCRGRAARPESVAEQSVERAAVRVGARRAELDVVAGDDGVVARGELLRRPPLCGERLLCLRRMRVADSEGVRRDRRTPSWDISAPI